MTTPMPTTSFTDPAPAQRLERAAAALAAHGFAVEILDDAAAARTRIKELIPEGASVFTGASETLRLSGIDEDINASGRYDAVRPRGLAMDRATQLDEIRRLLASPDVIVGSVAAVTETGSLVVASASGSQLPGYAGGSARAIWVVGAQKVVPDLSTALRRVEEHCLPLESDRAHGGLRAAQRHQPPAHPQRRTPPRARHRPAAPRSHRILNHPESSSRRLGPPLAETAAVPRASGSGLCRGRRGGGGAGAVFAGGGGAGWLGAHVVADAGHDVAQVVQVVVGQGGRTAGGVTWMWPGRTRSKRARPLFVMVTRVARSSSGEGPRVMRRPFPAGRPGRSGRCGCRRRRRLAASWSVGRACRRGGPGAGIARS